MKRFVFRFQRLLEVKESLERARKAELGEAMAVLNREEERLHDLERERMATQEAARRQRRAALEPPLLRVHDDYLQRLEREIAEQKRHLQQVQAVVEDRRAKLVEARRERRVFEILEEKAREEHRRHFQRQYQLALDEVGERLHARNAVQRGALEN